MIFLHSDQIDISLLNQDIFKSNDILLTLNASIVQSMNIDNDLILAIKNTFSEDQNINSYIELLKNITLSREKNVKAYLEFFFLYNNELILYNELIYILENFKIKLEIL